MTESNVICSLNIVDKIFVGKDKVNKVICFADGRVIEYFNESIVGSCSTPLLNPSEISVFYSYEPFTKYYIIRQDTTLIVLRKLKETLNIFRTYKNVQIYETGDFLTVGRPQVKIWLLDEMEPLVTDFSKNNLCNLNNREKIEQFPDLNRKLHMLQSSLTRLNEISDNRKQMQSNFLKQFCEDGKSLKLKDSWLRIVNGKLIVCMCVVNDSEYKLGDLQLLITDISSCLNTRICDLTWSSAKDIFCRKELLCNSNVYVVGIINEPNFNNIKSGSSLSCSILYSILEKNEPIKRLKIPSFMLNVEDFISGKFDVFPLHQINENILLKDVISCIAIHEIIVLEINLNEGANESLLNEVLKNKLNFTRLHPNNKNMCVYISKTQFNSMLSNFIVFLEHLSGSAYSFVCYARDMDQVLLIKQCLVSFLQKDLLNARIKKVSSEHEESLVAAVNTLDEEFQHFTKIMKTAIPSPTLPIKEDNNLKFTVDTWKSLMECTLPVKTDLQLQRALKDD